jgi:hypothetical protein
LAYNEGMLKELLATDCHPWDSILRDTGTSGDVVAEIDRLLGKR